MADVFHQLYIQIVFAVKNRQSLISPSWEEEFYKYTTGIIQNRGHKLIAIGGMPDHVHIFIGFKPAEALSDLVREIKKGTQVFITNKNFTSIPFNWQSGYGAFSYSRSHIDRVSTYILNQKEHHRKITFEKEFKRMLQQYDIEIGKKQFFDFFYSDKS